MRGLRASKEVEREDNRVEETSSVDIRENCYMDGSEERSAEERVEGERDFWLLQMAVQEVIDFMWRKKLTVVVVRHSELGNRECQNTTGTCEDRVKLVPVLGGC